MHVRSIADCGDAKMVINLIKSARLVETDFILKISELMSRDQPELAISLLEKMKDPDACSY